MTDADLDAMERLVAEERIAPVVGTLCREVRRLRAALTLIARGDYDNAHDCKAAARLASVVISSDLTPKNPVPEG